MGEARRADETRQAGGAEDRGAAAEGLHRDAQLDGLGDQMGAGIWEAEGDTVTVQSLREALERALDIPLLAPLARALIEFGAEQTAALLEGVTARGTIRDVDPFGYDQAFVNQLEPLARFVLDKYFRCETSGLEHVPSDGRALLVANHSGTLPYDGMMVVSAVRFRHPSERVVRPMVENFLYHFPYLGMFMARTGSVRACQENAKALLESDQLALVFPEGVKGIGKLYRQRYKLQRFGRGGAVRLALSTGSPIIPVSIVGAEESMPLVSKLSWLAAPLGLPYVPITPTLPLLGPLGLVPYPTKWFIDFGEPIHVDELGPEALKDRVLVNRLNEQVRGRIQDMIDERLALRHSVFLG